MDLDLQDINTFRKSYESDREWNARRNFIQRNKDTIANCLSLDSLSLCWVNMEILGCQYPKKTMEKIKDLAIGLTIGDDEHSPDQQFSNYIKFVKDTTQTDTSRKRLSDTHIDKESVSLQKTPRTHETQTDVNDDVKLSPNKHLLEATNSTDGLLTKSYVNKDTPIPTLKCKKKPFDECSVVERFILFVAAYVKNYKDANIQDLTNSFSMNNIAVEYRMLKLKCSSGVECSITFNSVMVIRSQAADKSIAQSNCLEYLLQYFITNAVVLRLNHPQTDTADQSAIFQRSQIASLNQNSNMMETSGCTEALSSTNKGHQMLAKMGWNPNHGLGKTNQGRTQPIESVNYNFQKGLGYVMSKSKDNTSFKFKKALEIVSDYVESGEKESLIFSTDFSSNERCILHRAVHLYKKRYNVPTLHSCSHGKDNERALIISHKIKTSEMFDEIYKVGQGIYKYTVLSLGKFT